MKLRILTICLSLLMTAGLLTIDNKAHAESPVSFSAGFTYNSAYFWRGSEIDSGEGVFWPSVGMDVSGVSFGVTAGLDTGYFTVSDKDTDKENIALTEIDYSVGYGLSIGEMVSVDFGVLFAQYPYYDEVDKNAEDPSFIEGSVAVGLSLPLSPGVEIYYDYFAFDDSDDANTSEDFYFKFTLGHDLIATDTLTVSLGAWAGYYNNAYAGDDVKGWSDAGLSLSTSQSYKDVSFDAALNYARSLSKEFQGANENYKNHFWADFGVSKSF